MGMLRVLGTSAGDAALIDPVKSFNGASATALA
jgi:hypothetical protein